MDSARVELLRDLLSTTGWVDRTRGFARSLRRSTDKGSGLLLVGTPTQEPWHLAAHLDDESRFSGIPTLMPTLVRWNPPPNAPAHLSVGLDRIENAGRGETLFVVAPDNPTDDLLERLTDARRSGATLLTLDSGDKDLASLAHDQLIVPSTGLVSATGEPLSANQHEFNLESLRRGPIAEVELVTASMSFDTVQHLVSVAAGEEPEVGASSRRRLKDRLGRMLDQIQGTPAPTDW
jgi:hypothetical protein